MPAVPSISPATGLPTPSSYIHTTASSFVDTSGRTLLLRGINLSGSSKAPIDKPSHLRDGFWEDAEEGGQSFFGRPLVLEDGTADVHLARLKGWGFDMLRFPVTWEALEHEGPGIYDYDFMDYTIRVLRKCKEYGFKVYMDPHQDTWSRFSGGSGAPYWTLPACGINPRNISTTAAALIHCEYPSPDSAEPSSLPSMIWSTNYGRLVSQTMFTLFFAGRDFAPLCVIDGVNIQDWLQDHYIAAFAALAERIREAGDLFDECVVGWDSMNEPFEGLCGWPDITLNPTKQGSTLKKGTHPTPAQGMRLGMGKAEKVEKWKFSGFGPARDGDEVIDPKGVVVWADPSTEIDGVHPKWGWKRDADWKLGTCVWALHGVWDVQSGFVMKPEYFRYLPGTESLGGTSGGKALKGAEIEFVSDYWKPHFMKYARRIRLAHPEAILFIQPPVFAPPPKFLGEQSSLAISDEDNIEEEKPVLKGRAAYSAHYYDGLTLVTKHWNWFNADALGLLRGKYKSTLNAVKIGEAAIRRSLGEQLGYLKADAKIVGDFPTLIGEIGTPMNMDDGYSYGWTDKGKGRGKYDKQERALDASLSAGDGRNGIGWTMWTYVVGDEVSHEWGDGWNGEDLGLWCVDDMWPRNDGECEDAQQQQLGESQEFFPPGAYMPGESRDLLVAKRNKNGRVRTAVVKTSSATSSSLSLASLPPSALREIRTSSPTPIPSMIQKFVEMTPLEKAGWPPYRKPPSSTPSRSGTAPASTVNLPVAVVPAAVLPPLSSSAASSSSSSSTSTSPSSSPRLPTSSAPSQQEQTKVHPNPYTFLTNGARAVRAFCRPRPVKTVGRIEQVKFEISSSKFLLDVVVNEEDGVAMRRRRAGREQQQQRGRGRGRGRQGGREVLEEESGGGGEGEGEEVVTEIFVPLVHYAHERVLEDAVKEWREVLAEQSGCREGGEDEVLANGGVASNGEEERTLRRRSSAVAFNRTRTPERHGEDGSEGSMDEGDDATASGERERGRRCGGEDSLASEVTVIGAPSSSSLQCAGMPSPAIARAMFDERLDLVDLDVVVNGGEWSVVGQTLKWRYPVPREGEGEARYRIEIKRKGGAIGGRRWERAGVPEGVKDMKDWSSKTRWRRAGVGKKRREGGFCDRLCGDCCIM